MPPVITGICRHFAAAAACAQAKRLHAGSAIIDVFIHARHFAAGRGQVIDHLHGAADGLGFQGRLDRRFYRCGVVVRPGFFATTPGSPRYQFSRHSKRPSTVTFGHFINPPGFPQRYATTLKTPTTAVQYTAIGAALPGSARIAPDTTSSATCAFGRAVVELNDQASASCQGRWHARQRHHGRVRVRDRSRFTCFKVHQQF